MKIVYYTALAILILVLVVLAFYLIVGYISYKFCLTRKGGMIKRIQKKYGEYLNKANIDKNYFKDFLKLEIQSQDNLKLKGFYKDNNSSKLVILVHGYGRDHFEITNIAKMFDFRGYDILAIDQRCHGQSEGENITMGMEESKDILLWINKMLEIKSHYKIVLFGMSMGASAVCMTVGENIPNNVVLAVEDCGYDNAEKQFSYVYSKRKLHFKFIFKIFTSFTKKTIGLDLKKVDTIQKLKKSKIPIMFIHGEKDNFVPTEMVYNMSSQISESRQNIYIAKDAGHTMSSVCDMRKYEKELNNFLTKYYM